MTDEELFGIICSAGIDLALPKTIDVKPVPAELVQTRKCRALG